MNIFRRVNRLLRPLKKEDKHFKRNIRRDDAGRIIIDVAIKDESELYSDFSLRGEKRISPELMAYLMSQNAHVGAVVINVQNPDFAHDEKKQNEFKKILREEFGYENFKQSVRMRFNLLKAATLFLMGLLIIGMSFLLQSRELKGIITETITILAWVLIWEAFDSIIFERLDIKKEYIYHARIRSALIRFSE